jgi:hypothetical protein
MESEVQADAEGYVVCPRRGDISVEWCEGCPHRLSIQSHGGRIVVVCAAGPQSRRVGDVSSSLLRDVPDLWR